MFTKFLKDRSGSFAVPFAIGMSVLLLGVGVAIDYTDVTRKKSYIQNLADSGALAAAASREQADSKLKSIASLHVQEQNTLGATVTTDVNIINDVIVVKTRTAHKTHLMGIFGRDTVNVSAVAESPIRDETPISLSLVLDRTGSMNGANIAALKTASKSMIDTFDSYKANIKTSVVPFSQYVNVGVSNRNATWMNVPADYTERGTEVCRMKRDLVSPGKCTTRKVKKTCTNDGVSYTCYKTERSCPSTAYGPEYQHCYIPTRNVKWHGCAGSRNTPLNKVPEYKNRKIPGVMNVKCGQEVLPLTKDTRRVKNKIDSLTASGETYLPSGLIWGWRTLEASQPFNDITSADKKRKRVLVLMTDGKNTKSLTSKTHDGNNANQANKLTTEICEGIKNNEIEVYTVAYRFGAGDKKAKNVVKDCASSQSNFFEAQNAQQLKDAFDNIARSLFNVRLSS